MSVGGKLRPLPADLWTDEDLIELPLPVRMTAIGLRLHADDQGRETVTDWTLRPSIWPGPHGVSASELVEHLLLLDYAGYIGLYSDEKRTFYQVREWPAVSHPRPSRFPPPPPDLFQRFAGRPPANFSAQEREGGSGGEGESEARAHAAGGRPSPFCRVHQPNGTEADCRHCGTARNALDQWKAQRAAEDTPDA